MAKHFHSWSGGVGESPLEKQRVGCSDSPQLAASQQPAVRAFQMKVMYTTVMGGLVRLFGSAALLGVKLPPLGQPPYHFWIADDPGVIAWKLRN
jgi:hypothetical protein